MTLKSMRIASVLFDSQDRIERFVVLLFKRSWKLPKVFINCYNILVVASPNSVNTFDYQQIVTVGKCSGIVISLSVLCSSLALAFLFRQSR